MDLVVTGLAVARGGVAVLAGVSLRLAPRQALVLRGPNGVGKTTLLRCIAGLQPALAGRVEAPADSMAYAGHADGIKAVLTVAENLAFWARVYRQGGVDAALAALNLTGLADRRAADLSAGQKRRLGLARLLVTGRPIWLLDEPTVALDAGSVQVFAGVLQRHLAAGGSALIATHIDPGIAAEVLDLTQYRATDGAYAGAFG